MSSPKTVTAKLTINLLSSLKQKSVVFVVVLTTRLPRAVPVIPYLPAKATVANVVADLRLFFFGENGWEHMLNMLPLSRCSEQTSQEIKTKPVSYKRICWHYSRHGNWYLRDEYTSMVKSLIHEHD